MTSFEILQNTDKIIEMYKNNYTFREIGNCFGLDRRTVSKIVKNNGMPIKRFKRKFAEYYEQILSPRQKEILIGSILGDGHINKHHTGENSCRYIETHSIDQKEYALWKYSEFKNFMSSNYRIIDNTNSKSYGTKETIVFSTVLHKEFVQFRDMFYLDSKKIVPQNIKNFLTPLGLSVWFMDDGSNSKNIARFSTYSFNKEEIENLINALKYNFGLSSYIINSHKGMVISLNKTESNKMFNLIKPYVVKSMDYKIRSINNPVETEDSVPRASVLKCSEVKTFGSCKLLTR